MAYANESIWIGRTLAWCPSKDTAGNGTTTLTDFTGIGNGTLTNMDAGTDWVLSDSKYALDFDGTNDYVISPSLPLAGLSKLTMSYWVKKASSSHGPHFTIGVSVTDASNRVTIQPWNDARIYFTFATAFGYCTLNDTNWHHVLMVYDGSQSTNAAKLLVWLDGSAQTLTFSGTIPASIGMSNHRAMLGVTPTGTAQYGAGLVDDACVLYRVPTSTERTLLSSSRGASYDEAATGGVYNPFIQPRIR